MQPRVLVIDRGELGPVLGQLGSIAVLETRTELENLPPDGEYQVLVADYDKLSPAQRELILEGFRGFERDTRLLLVSERECRHDFPQLFGARTLTNLVARNGEIDPENLLITLRKLLRGDIFGVEQYLDKDIHALHREFNRSDQKPELLAAIETFAAERSFKSWLTRLLSSVADEFFTNAIYNAPVDDQGHHLFADWPRTRVVELPVGQHVQMKVTTDDRRVGISMIDPYGSLTPERLLDYLARCFRKGEDQVDEKQGGAGLGFYTVFESLTHFVVNLAPGRRTEMIGLLDVERSYRQFAARSKSFNIFMSG